MTTSGSTNHQLPVAPAGQLRVTRFVRLKSVPIFVFPYRSIEFRDFIYS